MYGRAVTSPMARVAMARTAAARIAMARIAGARVRVPASLAAASLAVLLLGACTHLQWPPWRQPLPAPPAEVHELDIGGASAATHFAQYWQRNTLLVDLRGAAGSGALVLRPAAGHPWPVRLAFRVSPGAVGMLEVHADQRVVLPITPGAGGTVDLELSPGVYTARTRKLYVGWGPAAAVPPLPEPKPRR